MATQIGLPASPQAQAPVTLSSIIAQQEEIFARRQPESRRMADRAGHALAGGVTSSWQITRPQPVWLSHGKGSKIYDVDGNEYVDLHGGYGAALAGHGHPAIVEAVRGQVALGTHFAQPRTTPSWPPRSCPAGSACHSGGSPTQAPRRPWTPST